MFKDVSVMNEAFGNPKGNPRIVNWNRLESQCLNIVDEYDELMSAIEGRDVSGIRDALCDILVFTLGAQHFLGIDGDLDMKAVFESNMSKFCKDELELQRTIEKYNALKVAFFVEGEFPTKCLKAVQDCIDDLGNQYRKGKFLKAVGYQPPVFPSAQETCP